MTIRRETKSFPIAGIKALDTEAGTFEAIVSVFGNVDYHGHRIDSHAFDASLEDWKTKGDPIPVIFSHQWDNLNAYLGEVDPADVAALQPGDSELPAEIKEFGGLRVKGTIDTTEPEGRKSLKLLKSRAIKEFSFAYDVIDEAKADDGFTDLLELGLIEIGPTLLGANPLTQLIGAKNARGADLAGIAEAFGIKATDVAELAAAVATLGEDRPDRSAKAFVSLPDTVERLQEAILRAGIDWASDLYGDNLYTVHLEGTYPADGRAVLYVELWDDPPMQGRYFEAGFEVAGGVVTLDDPTPVELAATIVTKNRIPSGRNTKGTPAAKAGARNAAADLERIQSIHDATTELGAECADEDPDGEADDDTGTESRVTENTAPSVILARLESELLEISGPST